MAKAPDFVKAQGLPLLAHRLRRLSELFLDGYGDWLPDVGVTAPPRALSLLRLLDEEGPLGITFIADRLRLTHPLIIALVAALEEDGLVEIARDPGDGRRRMVGLSAEGRAQASAARQALAVMADAYRDLAAETGIDLMDAVERIERACAATSFELRLHQATAAAALTGKETPCDT